MVTCAPRLPRLVITGLSGGSGKTLVSLGLVRAFSRRGLAVAPFKKGPDYIDAKWLSLAAGRPAINLDTYMVPPAQVLGRFVQAGQGFDLAVIEGNRGVFDGLDEHGSMSTAALARLLDAPVALTLDTTKMTRTAAAIVAGIANFEPDLNLAGVVCNRTAGPRHQDILRRSMARSTGVPVLGTLPKLAANPIPERHMGLMSDQEMDFTVDSALEQLADLMEEHLDLDAVLAMARAASPVLVGEAPAWPQQVTGRQPVIGVVRDAALWFYYPENLEALERAGARLEFVSALSAQPWPELHGLYVGGGFPETHAPQLAANTAIRQHIRELAASGLPIYAECGGLMYLAQALEQAATADEAGGASQPMAGVLPIRTRLCKRPQGLGYVEAKVVADNPFHPLGTHLKGHEFHYSRCVDTLPEGSVTALGLSRGSGMAQGRDGLLAGPHNNVFAAYSHLHALGAPHWAPNFVRAAAEYQAGGSAPGPRRGR